MEKQYSEKQYSDMAVQANKRGEYLYIYQHDVDYDVEVLEWNYKEEQIEREVVDEEGNITIETVTITVQDSPIMVEEEVVNPETGEKEIVEVQKHHTETRTKTIQELIIAPYNMYICIKDNVTLGEINPEYDAAEIRKAKFLEQFFLVGEVAKVVNEEGEEVPVNGYYRKRPEGYTSAIESLNTAFNAVTAQGSLPANTILFYAEPDFTDPVQVTEEWLVSHQISNEEMAKEEFYAFFAKFVYAWNTAEHQK